MNYGTLNTLNGILKNLQADAATLGLTVAGLMIVVYVIMVMITDDTNVAAHHKRWENLRKVFLCAALIAAAGAIITFGQQLGQGLHP
ncbi:hypothetical protein [Dictyobacter formicarum]|uniref:DUF350 domain-containing protein n=1 Tax=Dictyobacter formicarum TaxID=2778368 RepID=A0ABQ3V912_9CHLR|nr:hypothetical protein [Dictyobacter formicarum]GHO82318.1 hypothetical protein KSZ_03240 [Dictyobacter formicarum]